MAQQQHQKHNIGWIGLGEMGVGMALNLQKHLIKVHGHPLTVWNRSPGKTAPLEKEGAVVVIATSIESLLAQSNIVFTSLLDGAAVESVYSILLEQARLRSDPIIFVETSTIYPTLASKLAAQLTAESPQHRFLQCPVFGRPTAAAAAQLVCVTSGDEATIALIRPYIESMSRATLDLKTKDVSRASALKLVGNFMVTGSIELLSEGFVLASKNAIEGEDMLKFIELMFPSPTWLVYSKLIAERMQKDKDEGEGKAKGMEGGGENQPLVTGASVSLGLKDVGYIRQLAKESGARLPMAEVTYQHLKTMQGRGYGDQDWTSIIKALQE